MGKAKAGDLKFHQTLKFIQLKQRDTTQRRHYKKKWQMERLYASKVLITPYLQASQKKSRDFFTQTIKQKRYDPQPLITRNIRTEGRLLNNFCAKAKLRSREQSKRKANFAAFDSLLIGVEGKSNELSILFSSVQIRTLGLQQ